MSFILSLIGIITILELQLAKMMGFTGKSLNYLNIGIISLNLSIAYAINSVANLIYIPKYLSHTQKMVLVLCAMGGFYSWSPIRNYEIIERTVIDHPQNITQDGDEWKDLKYGMGTIGDYGCAPIAVANLFDKINFRYNFIDIVAYFEKHLLCGGVLGTDQTSVIEYLNNVMPNDYYVEKVNLDGLEKYMNSNGEVDNKKLKKSKYYEYLSQYEHFISLTFNANGITLHFSYQDQKSIEYNNKLAYLIGIRRT